MRRFMRLVSCILSWKFVGDPPRAEASACEPRGDGTPDASHRAACDSPRRLRKTQPEPDDRRGPSPQLPHVSQPKGLSSAWSFRTHSITEWLVEGEAPTAPGVFPAVSNVHAKSGWKTPSMDDATKYCRGTICVPSGVVITGNNYVAFRTSSTIRPSDMLCEANVGLVVLSDATIHDTKGTQQVPAVMVRPDDVSFIELPTAHRVPRPCG
jgi:hypothetical protein